jgi:hypothetical protein
MGTLILIAAAILAVIIILYFVGIPLFVLIGQLLRRRTLNRALRHLAKERAKRERSNC